MAQAGMEVVAWVRDGMAAVCHQVGTGEVQAGMVVQALMGAAEEAPHQDQAGTEEEGARHHHQNGMEEWVPHQGRLGMEEAHRNPHQNGTTINQIQIRPIHLRKIRLIQGKRAQRRVHPLCR